MFQQLRDLWVGAVDYWHWLDVELTEWMVGEGAWMKTEQIPACPVGEAGHRAADRHGRATGHPLCEEHFTRLGRMLRAIEEEAGDLDPAPSIAIQWNTGGGGHSTGGAPAHEQAPARLDALVLTDPRRGRGDEEDSVDRHAAGRAEPVLLVLAEYAARVRDERGLAYPAVSYVDCVDRLPGARWHGPAIGLPCRHPACRGITVERSIPTPLTVHSERQVLSRHLDWIVRWVPTEEYSYGIVEVYDRLRRLLGRLRRCNGTAQEPVGRCPADRADGSRCGGPLWPVRPKHTVGEWTGSTPEAVRCADCDTRWEGAAEMARLVLMMEQPRRPKESST